MEGLGLLRRRYLVLASVPSTVTGVFGGRVGHYSHAVDQKINDIHHSVLVTLTYLPYTHEEAHHGHFSSQLEFYPLVFARN